MSSVSISVDSHPSLDLAAFVLQNASESGSQGNVFSLFSLADDAIAKSPFEIHSDPQRYDTVKSAVRDLLRHAGYKPTGRGKPASEYLVKAAGSGKLNSINPVVDALNVVSLHSGLPISVVDLAKCHFESGALRVAIAPENSEYVFNASGQTIKLDGLLCLFDDEGPCANAVKDSQRTKTNDQTVCSLVLIWGTNELSGHAAKTAAWFRELIEKHGLGEVENVEFLVP
ncbi:phenylalanine--tRNA ligase beta subunit-related protein [Mariniblastus fucicola]|uniref:B3/4 domain protein n=1 Tax=Mariniblastus fucicola TaxID=980251 RepID=A0A5B9PE12_9BACT|nr:phenylalanine--tRNA ligase beta subunit-related protein [Mariniblastus fucicola]QEG21183.1 B3/4 domain protein [Mariniblastus fucicola]